MDGTKTFVSNKRDKRGESAEKSETKDSITLKIQKLVISPKEQETDANEQGPSLKQICMKRKKFQDDQQEMEEKNRPHKRTIQVTSEYKSYQSPKNVANQDIDNSDNSSENNIEVTNREVEIRNKTSLKSKLFQIFTKKKCVSQIEKCDKNTKETKKSLDEFQDIKNLKSKLQNIRDKANMHKVIAKPLPSTDNSQCPSGNAIESKDMTLFSSLVQPTCAQISPCESATTPKFSRFKWSAKEVLVLPTSTQKVPCKFETSPEFSKVKPAEEVLEHFRWHMQASPEPFNRIITSGDIIMEDTESGNHDLENLNKTTEESSTWGLKSLTNEMVSAATRESSEVSPTKVANSSAIIQNISTSPRRRIVEDVANEWVRWWIIQKIKDKEVLMKLRIMEGKYSDDMETKIRCIERAKDIQEVIDSLFDALDDHGKLQNIPKRLKRYVKSTDRHSSKSTTKIEGDFKLPKMRIKTFNSLFKHLSIGSESSNKNIFERINAKNLISAYNLYQETKKKMDHESETLKRTVKSETGEFIESLAECRPCVKCKIAYPESRSLEDYQNYVSELRLAVFENLDILETLIPFAIAVICPLMSYLTESFKTIVEIFYFLNEKRPDVFPGSSDRNIVFFDDFCKRHFKD